MWSKLEINDLHSANQCLRDVVAICTWSASWLGAEPLKIAESLASSLFPILEPEFIYIALAEGPGTPSVAVAQNDCFQPDSSLAKELGPVVAAWGRDDSELLRIPDPRGDGTLHVATRRIGCQGDLGIIVAAFPEGCPPTAVKHLILNVAATQAATAIQNGRLLANTRRTSEQLRHQLAVTTAVNNSLGEGLFTVDQEGRVTFMNPAAEKAFGWTQGELLGKNIHQAIHHHRPDGTEYAAEECTFLAVLQTGRIVRSEDEQFIRKDGTFFPVACTSSPIVSDERVIGAVFVFQDITDRNKAAQALRRSEANLRDFVENGSIGLHWVGPDGTILWANQKELDLLGYTREEYVGRNITEFHADPSTIADILRRLSAGETLCDYEARLRCKDGSIRHVVINSNVLFDNGEFIHTRCFTRDITEQKMAEAALRRSEDFNRTIVESSRDCIATLSLTGELLWLSDAGRKVLHGNDSANPTGQCWIEIWQAEDQEGARAAVAQAAGGGTGQFVGSLALREDPNWWDVMISPILDAQGNPERLLAVSRDVTERKQAEEALRKSEERFRAFVTASSDVVYQMSADWSEMRHLQGRDFIADTLDPSRTWLDKYIYAADQSHVMAVIREAIRTKSVFELEHRVRRVDGTVGWTFSRAIPLLDRNGEVLEWFGAASDVTERKLTEQALRKQLNLTQSITDNATTALFIMDEKQQCVFMNPAAEQLTGFTSAEVSARGGALHDIIHHTRSDGSPYPLEECPIDQAFPTRNKMQGEEVFVHKDGHFYNVAFTASPMRDDTGTPVGTVIEVQDITERKRAETNAAFLASLSQDLTRLATVDELLETAGTRIGAHLHLSLCAFLELYESSDQAFITYEWRRDGLPSLKGAHGVADMISGELRRAPHTTDVFVVRDTGTEPRIHADSYAKLKIGSYVAVPLVRDGRSRFLLCAFYSTPYNWRDDEIELVRELTARIWARVERARAEEALRESEAYFRELTQRMPHVVWTNLPDGRVDFVNDVWLNYAGQTLEYVRTRPEAWMSALHPDDRERAGVTYLQGIRSGQGFTMEARFRRASDGTYRWFLNRCRPLRDAAGNIYKFVGTCTEIDDGKRAEEKLEQTVAERTAKLRETVGELEAYSYSISHDMRAPLRAMQTYAHVLLTDHREQLDTAGRRYLDRIMNSAHRLDKLIQDVLSYSRIARADVRYESVNLDRLIEDICNEYPSVHTAEIEIRGPLGSVVGAEALLAQALSNLLTNAAKFVAPGQTPRIKIWTEVINAGTGFRSDTSNVRLYVQDHGIGINPADQQRIFGIFSRVYGQEYEGTGIGLSIVKKAVERMGGTLGLQSEPGKGSTFWMELPKA